MQLTEGITMKPRLHQAELRQKLDRWEGKRDGLTILAYVVPGGGKSWLPMIVKERWPELKIAWFVPRTSLQNQAVECAKKNFGVDLMAVNGTETNPCKGKQGFVATMQSLSMDPHTWLDAILKYGPFV